MTKTNSRSILTERNGTPFLIILCAIPVESHSGFLKAFFVVLIRVPDEPPSSFLRFFFKSQVFLSSHDEPRSSVSFVSVLFNLRCSCSVTFGIFLFSKNSRPFKTLFIVFRCDLFHFQATLMARSCVLALSGSCINNGTLRLLTKLTNYRVETTQYYEYGVIHVNVEVLYWKRNDWILYHEKSIKMYRTDFWEKNSKLSTSIISKHEKWNLAFFCPKVFNFIPIRPVSVQNKDKNLLSKPSLPLRCFGW